MGDPRGRSPRRTGATATRLRTDPTAAWIPSS